MKCLVTGATGFIGRELCQVLSEAHSSYLPLSRTGSTLPNGMATVAVDLATGDIESELLQNIDVVYHLAGIAHQNAQEDMYSRVNHHATLALARSSAAAGVRCFVYLSSVKAMGAASDGQVRAETDCCTPTDAYGLSKLRAEQDLCSLLAGGEMSLVILRPALVYGAQVKGNLLLLSRAVRAGLPRPPERGGRSMIAVQDLARLMCHVGLHPPSGVHTWIVCDGKRYSAQRIFDLMRVSLGKKPGLSWLPLWAWRFAAYMRDGLQQRGTDALFFKLFGSELYSSAALIRDVEWQPRLTLSDIMAQLMASPEREK